MYLFPPLHAAVNKLDTILFVSLSLKMMFVTADQHTDVSFVVGYGFSFKIQ
jgi:hypothetical protein